MTMRRRDLQQLDLSAALDVARDAATRTGVSIEHRVEQVPPATSLVVSSSDPATAKVTVSTIEPGTMFLDIGAGLHGEWLLRSAGEVATALADLGIIFEAVFRGNVEERVRRFPGGRHSIQGFVKAADKTYRFRHHAVGLTAQAGSHHYAPYPPITA